MPDNHVCYDANYVFKLQCAEPGSVEVKAHATTVNVICCAFHGRAEFASACHRKVREGRANPAQLRAMLGQVHADVAAGALRWLPCTDSILDQIEVAFATAPSAFYLRAADAIHLATAAEYGFSEIDSNDKHLLAAASHFGIKGVNVIP